MTDNLPSTNLSPAAKQKQRTDALVQAVMDRNKELKALLKDSGIEFDRFVEVFRRALIQNPDLLLADGGSVIQACMNACTDGLLPDGRQGAIVVYNQKISRRGEPEAWGKRAQWQPMFQGLLDVAYRSGNFKSIQARVVYEGDTWDYEMGIEPRIVHKPAPRPAQAANPNVTAKAIIASYAVAHTVNGGVFVEVFEGDDIRKVNAVSRATNGPGKQWPEEFARKGPLRRMWKYLPRDQRMDRIVDHDDENYDLDALEQPEVAAPALKTGFAPKPAQIEQGADQVLDVPMDRVEDPEHAEQETDGPADGGAQQMAREPDDEPAPDTGEIGDEIPPRIREYQERLKAATSWLNIKQAIRSLYKEENWDRPAWEQTVLSMAWARKTTLGDKTDFVTDVFAFACWICGAEPADQDVSDNLSVLHTQRDYKSAQPEIQEWVDRLATLNPPEQS